MSDHYHHASEVQGAALDGHSHTPREIGAAEEHDLTMHLRDYQALAHTVSQLQGLSARDAAEFRQSIANLEHRAIEQGRQLAEQARLIGELRGGLADLAGLVSDLSSKTAESLEVISSAVHSIGG